MAYTKYSLTPANNNAAPPDGAPEGMLPSAVNDTMRDMMAQIRDCGDGIRGGTYTMTAPVITGGSINGSAIGASSASTGAFTTLSASSTVSGTGFSNYFASPPALGGTAAAAVSSTNLSYTGTLTGGTGVVNLGSGQFYKDASGAIGVGTTSPTSIAGYGALTINGSGSGSLLDLQTSGTLQARILSLPADLRINQIVSGSLSLYTANTERMRIDSGGQVLIGATAPLGGEKLYVNGSETLGIFGNATTSCKIGTYISNTLWGFSDGGVSNGIFGNTSTNTTYIAAAGVNALNINNVGNVALRGATTSANGVGITFPATQSASSDANTLDDYEEGTWTPNQGSGLVVTGAFSSNGNYTKIGRMVYVSGAVTGATSITFATTAVICTNLPFTAITSPQQAGSGVMGNTASGPPTLAFNTTVFSLSAGSGGTSFFFNIAYQI